jgi:hypothetical protein
MDSVLLSPIVFRSVRRPLMSELLKSRIALAVVSVLMLGIGYALPRSERRGGDMLDAVAAVQRRAPRFLITERVPGGNWLRAGALYLSHRPKTPEAMEELSIDPNRADPNWTGVVCFRGTADPNVYLLPWVESGGNRCIEYGDFAVYGDPDVLHEVRHILASEGFRPPRER